MTPPDLSPELRFVCACCRWPDDAARRSAIAAAAASVTDWERVATLAREHRVEGLVANGAAHAQLPPDASARFSERAGRVKRRALEDAAETIRLTRAFDSAGLSHAILKGVPLGVRAFGTPALKQSWDIDLLVAPADAVAAAAVLGELGYRPQVPARPFTRAEFERWSAVSIESEFRSAKGRTVELHWGVSDHPLLLTGIGVEHADLRVGLLGAAVPTLGDAANLAYLAVHGAKHGWSRIKWLADFAGFLSAGASSDRAGLIAEARRFAVGHAIDQGLVLSDRLFGTRLGPVAADAEADRLARLAATAIVRRGVAGDFERDRVAGRAIGEIRSRLMPGARYRLVAIYRLLKGSEDRRLIPLPAGLGWAYWVMRPFSATVRTVSRRLRSEGN